MVKESNNRAKLMGVILLTPIFLFLVCFSAFAADETIIIDLGALPGGDISYAYDINNSNQVVGLSWGKQHIDYPPTNGFDFDYIHAFLWENGVMGDLVTLGGPMSTAYGINDVGNVIGKIEGEHSHASLWSNGITTDLGTLGGLTSSAYGINNSTQIVGSSQTSSGNTHAFIWEGGVMRDLGTLGGSVIIAYDINNSRQIVGGSRVSGLDTHAFLFEDGVMKDLGSLGGTWSTAFGINDSGKIVGYSELSGDSTFHAFLWDGAVMKDLGALGGTESMAYDINNSGQIVGWTGAAGMPLYAFLWQDGVMRDLNAFLPENSGWELLEATAINDEGWIVGGGFINNIMHGFLMKPNIVPEPLSCVLFLLGGVALFAGRRLRRRK